MDGQVPNAKHHDPFDDERWSLSQAAAWIILRSKERVSQLLSNIAAEREGGVHVFDIFGEAAQRETVRGRAPEGSVLPFVEAQAELWEELKRGRVRALGIQVGEATWSQIAPDAWRELDYFYCDNGRSTAIGSSGLKKYLDVTLPRDDVLNLWPRIPSATAQSKRGPKRKIPQDEIDLVAFKLLDHHGSLSDDDPEWHSKGQLEAATAEKLKQKFGKSNVPGESTLRTYVAESYKKWIERQS